MTNVYFRHHNGNLGKFEAATDNHITAICAVQDRLNDEWRKVPHPVLAVVGNRPQAIEMEQKNG